MKLILRLCAKTSKLFCATTYFQKEHIYKRYLYLDSQRINQSSVYNFLNELKSKYEVSNEAAKFRLISLGLLKEHL
jgi:hypothetical protein